MNATAVRKVTVAATVRDVTRQIEVESSAAWEHVRNVGVTFEQAQQLEAHWTLGAQLVQEEIDRNGITAGERLAQDLESEVAEITEVIMGLRSKATYIEAVRRNVTVTRDEVDSRVTVETAVDHDNGDATTWRVFVDGQRAGTYTTQAGVNRRVAKELGR